MNWVAEGVRRMSDRDVAKQQIWTAVGWPRRGEAQGWAEQETLPSGMEGDN